MIIIFNKIMNNVRGFKIKIKIKFKNKNKKKKKKKKNKNKKKKNKNKNKNKNNIHNPKINRINKNIIIISKYRIYNRNPVFLKMLIIIMKTPHMFKFKEVNSYQVMVMNNTMYTRKNLKDFVQIINQVNIIGNLKKLFKL